MNKILTVTFIFIFIFVFINPMQAQQLDVELLLGSQSGDQGYGANFLLRPTDSFSGAFNYYYQENNYRNINFLVNYHLPDYFIGDYYTYLILGISQIEYEYPAEKYTGFMAGFNFERQVSENFLAHTDLRVGVYPDKLAGFYNLGFTYLFNNNFGVKLSYQGFNRNNGPVAGVRFKF